MKVASCGAAVGAVILSLSATPALAADTQIIISPTIVQPNQRIRVTTKCPSLGYDTYTLNVDGKAWGRGRLIKGSATGMGIAPKAQGPHKFSGRCLPCPGSVAKPVGIAGTSIIVDWPKRKPKPRPKPRHRFPRGGVNTGFGGTSPRPASSGPGTLDLGIAMTASAAGVLAWRRAWKATR